jgi:Zn-dependent protease
LTPTILQGKITTIKTKYYERRRAVAELSKQSGQSFIRKLGYMQKPFWIQLLVGIAFALFLYRVLNSWSMAIAFLVGVVIHEVGHWLVFRSLRIKTMLIFIFPLGAAAMPIDDYENQRSDELPLYQLSWLTLVGPFFNILLVIAGRLLETYGGSADLLQFGNDLVYANTILVVIQLIPIWTVDVGRLTNFIFLSVDEKGKQKVSLILAVSAMMVALILIFGLPRTDGIWGVRINIVERMIPLTFLLVSLAGVWRKQYLRHKLDVNPEQFMTPRQVITTTTAYFSLLLVLILAHWPIVFF